MLDINHDCLDIFILIHGEVTYDSELAFWLHQTGRPAIIFARILSADSIRPVYVCYVCFPPQALYCTRSSDLALPGCTEYCSWFDWVVSVERRSQEGNLVLRAPVCPCLAMESYLKFSAKQTLLSLCMCILFCRSYQTMAQEVLQRSAPCLDFIFWLPFSSSDTNGTNIWSHWILTGAPTVLIKIRNAVYICIECVVFTPYAFLLFFTWRELVQSVIIIV